MPKNECSQMANDLSAIVDGVTMTGSGEWVKRDVCVCVYVSQGI